MNLEPTTTAPLVLCHGLFGSLSDQSLLAPFADRTVLAPDLLGYGRFRHADLRGLTLEAQADHVAVAMDDASIARADIAGHSVGGAVAALVAIRHPERVRMLVSVEGNMMPADAFWSAALAKKTVGEIEALVEGYRADVGCWIAQAGVVPNVRTLRIATDWLSNQPAATLRAQASAVVRATDERSGVLRRLRERLAAGLDLHLIAGARSRDDWHVPPDIVAAARTMTVLKQRGHLMMLEAPTEFATVLQRVTRGGVVQADS